MNAQPSIRLPAVETTESLAALDAQFRQARDHGHTARMVTLQQRAATLYRATGDSDAECFFLTQAYIVALEADLPVYRALHARLLEMGREERRS